MHDRTLRYINYEKPEVEGNLTLKGHSKLCADIGTLKENAVLRFEDFFKVSIEVIQKDAKLYLHNVPRLTIGKACSNIKIFTQYCKIVIINAEEAFDGYIEVIHCQTLLPKSYTPKLYEGFHKLVEIESDYPETLKIKTIVYESLSDISSPTFV